MPVFIQNKYTTWYYSIIENAKTRVLPEGTYTESHHIIPASFYKEHNRDSRPGWLDGKHNSPDNLVDLTAREHFVSHWLLTKMTVGDARNKMYFAFLIITRLTKSHDVKINSRTYAIIRNTVSEHMTNNNPMHNLTPDEHTARSAKLSVSVKKSWESRDRDGMGEQLKQCWNDKTEEERRAHSEKVTESLSKLTPEEKEEAKLKRMESWNNRTPEEIAESERKRKETNASKSPEEIAESERKRKETNASKPPEVIADEKRRRAETNASKPEEERQATIDKRVETLQKRDSIECPHCGTSSRSRVNMERYHFDNCLKHPTPKTREPMPRTACVYCGTMVTNNIMIQYHGDQCKHKPVG